MFWGPLARRLGMSFVDDRSFDGCHSYTTDETIALVNNGEARLLLYWRWPMPNRSGREYVYIRQQHLLESCDPNNTFVFDGDHMLDTSVLDKRVRVLTPELGAANSLMFPYLPELERPYNYNPDTSLVYVGTPLERLEETERMLRATDIDFYGSWSKTDTVTELSTKHVMHGKVDNDKVLDTLSGRVSYIMAKPSYYAKDYVTPRWYEMAYASCAPIVSPGYAQLVNGTAMEQYVAHSPDDVNHLLERFNSDTPSHWQAVQDLRQWSRDVGSLQPWYDLFGA